MDHDLLLATLRYVSFHFYGFFVVQPKLYGCLQKHLNNIHFIKCSFMPVHNLYDMIHIPITISKFIHHTLFWWNFICRFLSGVAHFLHFGFLLFAFYSFLCQPKIPQLNVL